MRDQPEEFYSAARHRAAVLAQPWNGGMIRLTGSERLSWLQGMVTNDVEKLLPGEGTYAAHLNAQGKLVGQMTILVDPDSVLLTMESSNAEKLAMAMDRLIVMEDVVAEQMTGQWDSIGVFGPAAARVLDAWLGEPLNIRTKYHHRLFSDDRRVVCEDFGYTVWIPRGQNEAAIQGLLAAGAARIDGVTWNVLRIEAGLPIYGTDIDDTTTMSELGEKGISYDKGCYIGQEVVARIKYIGHVNRRLMGFVCEGGVPPQPRSMVRSGGKDAGYITSSVLSPGMGKPIALGFVHRAAAVAGAPVELVSGAATVMAAVAELPFIPSATWTVD